MPQLPALREQLHLVEQDVSEAARLRVLTSVVPGTGWNQEHRKDMGTG